MMTENYRRTTSVFDRLDPRALLVAATGAAFCFSFVQSIAVSMCCFAFSLVLVAAGRLSVFSVAKHLAFVNVFVLFIWVTVPLTMPGESLARLGPLSWSRDGVMLALLVTIKCNAILLAFLALMDGINLQQIGCALERLRVPAKLVFLFLFTCRYIQIIGEEWQRLQTAAKLRGFVAKNSIHTYKTVANMLGLTFIKAIDRSRRIYEAMLLRGFNGTFYTVSELRGTTADVFFIIVFYLVLVIFVYWDIFTL